MSSAPRLIDQLANLTAIRDLELLEFSLLKTLNGFLLPRSLSLVRLDSKGRPSMEIVYGDERCTIRSENLTLSREIRLADEYLSACDAQYYPIKLENGLLLVFALNATGVGRSYLQVFTDSELSKLDSHLMSGVLQIYRNFCSLMRHAQTDQLTGLANRKTFDESVAKVHELIPPEDEQFAGERRGHQPMNYWLVMVDIDHFKQVNDRFGHLYGDEVLVLLSQLMKVSFRADDMIFRFGGEEFVLIVRCPNQGACRVTLDRFRERVATYMFPQVGTVTVSLGVTRMLREIFTVTLLDYADQALYHSKKNGRNRVTFFDDLVSQGLASEEHIQPGGISFF